MKYKINEKRILEILREYDDDFKIENNAIKLKYSGDVYTLTDTRIEHIKKGYLDPEYAFFDNMITEKLHKHFSECFEEIKPKYSYEKCKKFLEDNGFVVHENIVASKRIYDQNDTLTVTCGFDYIIDKLSGDESVCLNLIGEVIATILHANKDKLLEE